MGLKTYLALAFAAVASAGTIHGCAGKCIGQAIKTSGCASSDSYCICSSETFHDTYDSCVPATCGYGKIEAAFAFAEKFCEAVSGTEYEEFTSEQWEGYIESEYESLQAENETLKAEYAEYHAQCHDLYEELKEGSYNKTLKQEYKNVRAKEEEIKDALEKLEEKYQKLLILAENHGVALSEYSSDPEHSTDPSSPPEYESDPEEYPEEPEEYPEDPEEPSESPSGTYPAGLYAPPVWYHGHQPGDPSYPSHPHGPSAHYPNHPWDPAHQPGKYPDPKPPHGYPPPVHQPGTYTDPAHPTKTPCTTTKSDPTEYPDPTSSANPYDPSSTPAPYEPSSTSVIYDPSSSLYPYPSSTLYPYPSATVISYPY